MRSLTVHTDQGLCNRLFAAVSALALCEISGRRPRIVWSPDERCAAAWSDLFANDWPVVDSDVDAGPAGGRGVAVHSWGRKNDRSSRFDILASPEEHLVLRSYQLLTLRGQTRHDAVKDLAKAKARELAPAPELRERIAAVVARSWSDDVIGVHIRRGDFVRHLRGDREDHSRAFVTAMHGEIAARPGVRFFVATDDGASANTVWDEADRHEEGLRERLLATFGAERIITCPPRTLRRDRALGVQDALVELMLLRRTRKILGTWSSSFTRFASFGTGSQGVLF